MKTKFCVVKHIREICSFTYFFRNRGWTTSWPIPKQHYKHHFSLAARIIFHKLTIVPSINPTSSSTFPNKPLFFQSLSSTKLESLFKYCPARISSTPPSQFTDRGLFILFTDSTF